MYLNMCVFSVILYRKFICESIITNIKYELSKYPKSKAKFNNISGIHESSSNLCSLLILNTQKHNYERE